MARERVYRHDEGLRRMLRGKLNRLARRTKRRAKSVDMLVNLPALVVAHKLKLNAIEE